GIVGGPSPGGTTGPGRGLRAPQPCGPPEPPHGRQSSASSASLPDIGRGNSLLRRVPAPELHTQRGRRRATDTRTACEASLGSVPFRRPVPRCVVPVFSSSVSVCTTDRLGCSRRSATYDDRVTTSS